GDRGVDRIRRLHKHRVYSITRGLDDMTRVRRDDITEDRVVTYQRRSHRLRVLPPQTRRTLQVGEQEGDRPRRQLGHRPKCPIRTTQTPSASSEQRRWPNITIP